jgi:hypothetical protein
VRAERPVDIASLAAFRVIFGSLLVVAVLRYWWKGGIYDAFVAPKFFFAYPGFAWVRPLPGPGMYVVYGAMLALALAFTLGVFFRISAVGLCLLFTYAHLCDAANYLNHYYLVSLLLALSSFLPLAASFSLDAKRRPSSRRELVPVWMLWLLQFQIGIVYFFGGLAKLNADWLVSAMPLKIWLAGEGDVPLLGPLLVRPEAPYVLSWLGAAFDLSAPFLLSARLTRPFAYALVVTFHLVTARLFQIGMFPFIMMGASLVFFPPSWPRRALATIAPRWSTSSTPSARLAPTPRVGLALAAAWAAVQVIVPLRHLAYGTDLFWTEEGYRFSWNVMLMEKTGSAEFTVKDPVSGASRLARARDWLTPFQVKMMATQPDMLLAFARHLARDAEARGERRPHVYADVVVVLNGREPARYVDPTIDLASEPARVFGHYEWLLPRPN